MKIKNGFYLISFEVLGLYVPFFVEKNSSLGAKASVIIGVNGSGKSRVLSLLVDEFDNISKIWASEYGEKEDVRLWEQRSILFFKNGERVKGVNLDKNKNGSIDSKIKYFLDGDVWEISRIGKNIYCTKNEEEVSIIELRLPDKLLAVAHLPVDKFRFSKNDEKEFYSYLGLRQSSNMTTTGALESKVVLSLIRTVVKGRGKKILSDWLPELGFEQPVIVEVGVTSKKFFEVNTSDDFLDVVVSNLERYRGLSRTLRNEEKKDVITLAKRFWLFWKDIVINHQMKTEGDKIANIEFFIADDGVKDLEGYNDIAELVDIGRHLRVLREFSLFVTKKGKRFRFSDLSSGEQQVIGTMTRLLEKLGTTSLIVIDEPEVSLHPAWQKRYIPKLLETLEDYPNSHVVIATHSHFLVSDVSTDKGSLTVAHGGEVPKFTTFDGEVYGRSSENILYRVFGIGTSGNFYVERDLANALKMLSGVEDICHSELENIHQRLLTVSGPDNEPMMKIVDEIGAYLKGTHDA